MQVSAGRVHPNRVLTLHADENQQYQDAASKAERARQLTRTSRPGSVTTSTVFKLGALRMFVIGF